MFFETDKKSNIITVDQFFAELIDINNQGDLTFNFTYSLNQIEAIQKNLTTVRVSVLSRTIPKELIFESGKQSQRTIELILKQTQNAKKRLKEQESFIVASKFSDITSRFNNEVVTKIKQNDLNGAKELLTKSALKTQTVHGLSVENEVKPLLQMMASDKIVSTTSQLSSSINIDSSTVILDLIKHGIDPSYVADMTHRSLSAKNSFEGILRSIKTREYETDKIVQLLNSYLFSNNREGFKTLSNEIDRDDTNIQIIESVLNETIDLTTTITIPKKAQKELKTTTTQFFVKFEVIDSVTRSPGITITKNLDVTQHIKLFKTPTKSPIVNVSANQKQSVANLRIKQIDQHATKVAVYKKNINIINVEPDEYSLIKTIDLSSGHETIVSIEKPNVSTNVYRVIALSEKGFQTSEFTNVILKPNKIYNDKSISLVTRTVMTGIEVEVSQFPPDVSHVEILCKDLTIHQANFENINETITLIDNVFKESGTFSLIHTLVNDYHVYEYIAKIVYKNGISEYSQSSIIEKLPFKPGQIDINVSNVEVISDLETPNVKFTMSARIIDKDLDVITTLLEKRGIRDLFFDELKQQRDTFNDLIVFNVERLNLTTGAREDFGVIVDEEFDDVKYQKTNSVQPLRLEHRYQYEISVSLRSIETVFETLKKTITDPVTNKQFTQKPAKGLHPVTLRDGIIVTEKGLKTKYSKNIFTHGKIGFFESIDVIFDKPKISISDVNAKKFDSHLNMVTWKVTNGFLNKIDHFIIMKDVHGVRTIVGKCHNNFEFGNFQFLHETTGHDKGELRYIILMILNDYTVSEEFLSNVVVV